MPLARHQFSVTDEQGNVVPSAFIEVRREIGGQPLVQLYSDRNGTTPLGNPFQADSEGFAAFHVAGGAYQIRAYKDGFERILRYVGVGTAQEVDLTGLVGLEWQGPWANETVYEINDAVENDGSAYICTTAHESGDDYDEPGVGDNWQDYWDLLAIGGGNVVGPEGGVSDGEIAVYDQTTGKLIKGSGTTIAALAASILDTVRDGVSSAYDTLAELATAVNALIGRTITAGNGLTGGGDLSANRTINVGQGTGITINADDVAIDKASDANVRAAASNKVLTSDLIESASAAVALSDASTVTVNWDAFIYATLEITTNRVLGNPTNGQPGTWRTILVSSDAGPDELTFGNQYGGELPTLDDITTSKKYLLSIFCKTTTQFLVSAIDGSDA